MSTIKRYGISTLIAAATVGTSVMLAGPASAETPYTDLGCEEQNGEWVCTQVDIPTQEMCEEMRDYAVENGADPYTIGCVTYDGGRTYELKTYWSGVNPTL